MVEYLKVLSLMVEYLKVLSLMVEPAYASLSVEPAYASKTSAKVIRTYRPRALKRP
jgi:hypothetical protein